MRIAVVGSGIAGNAAAWTRSQRYPVTVYERELRTGGHSHTVTVDYDGEPIAVDTGFIVYPAVRRQWPFRLEGISASCSRISASGRALFGACLLLPLVTFKIVGAIHWQALRLWLKGAKLVPRPQLGVDSIGSRPDGTKSGLSAVPN